MYVDVSTPCRLHFGLLRFEQPAGPSYGGLGMMLAAPRQVIRVDASHEWHAVGHDGERALAYVRRAWEACGGEARPTALRVEVMESIPAHHGLGGGTQLALAAAAAVRRLCQRSEATAEELARMTGRGRRSAIGCHGFVQGGLLYEAGRGPGELLGKLTRRVAVPAAWRVVLVTASRDAGLSGDPESKAFHRLPPVPPETTERLIQLAERAILPAAERDDNAIFGEALFEYGRLAGECFASVQGGPYASAEIAACVAALRAFGAHGVGQSSWGPTVFAIVEDQPHAEALVAQLRATPAWADHSMRITNADNHGAHTATPT